METFIRAMLVVIQLALFPDDSKSMTETLHCLVCPHNPQILIQLRICGKRDQIGYLADEFSISQSEGIEECTSHLKESHISLTTYQQLSEFMPRRILTV
ncbi:hypothetical protein TNCV_4932341 [Trichonephila clavipes]|nr:hypothetical protein TNCV_4932341 [Trichonephila clavipes]